MTFTRAQFFFIDVLRFSLEAKGYLFWVAFFYCVYFTVNLLKIKIIHMATYDTIYDYYACNDQTKTRIEKIDSIIDGLIDASVQAAANADIEEYRLDDGQTIIKTIYRDMTKLEQAISHFQRIRTKLINDNCIGRVQKLRDRDSFIINR